MADPWDSAPIVEVSPQAASLGGGNPWENAPIVKSAEKPTPSSDRYTIKGMQKESMATPSTRTEQNVAAAVDMAVSFPGMVVGQAMGAASGLDAALEGKGHEEVQKVRKEATQAFVEANPLNNPIHKMMVAAGHTEAYDKSDVSALFDKISGGISKGGEWMEAKTKGVIGKGDFEDLVNSAINLAVPEAAKLAGRVGGKLGEMKEAAKTAKGPVDEPVLRPDPSPLTPPKSDATPLSLAKQHIEETMGIKAPAETKALNAQRRADAKAAFAEDPLYADYLKNYAEGELDRKAPNELAADKLEEPKTLPEKVTPVLSEKQLPEMKSPSEVTTDRGVALTIAEGKSIARGGPSQELVDLTHTPTPKDFSLIAHDAQGRVVGYLDLSAKADGDFITKDVKVSEEARLHGIARALYKEAETRGHKVAVSGNRTEDGAALAKSLGREVVGADVMAPPKASSPQETRFPSIAEFTSIRFGPGGFITPKPVAPGRPLYRETNLDSLNDYMREDRYPVPSNIFVADSPELALGQGSNKGVKLTFRPDSVSGNEHVKPMTGDLAGREYKTDMVAPRAIVSITMKASEVKKLRTLAKQRLKAEFDQIDLGGGEVKFTRKGFEGPEKPTEITQILKTPGTQRTPEQIVQLRRFRKEGGQIDPKLLGKMAAVGLGAAAGLYLDPDHPVEGAVLGSVAGFFGGRAMTAPIKAGKAIAEVFKTDKRLRMNEIADTHEISIERAARAIWQKQAAIYEKVPEQARREAITNWMQGDKSIPLNKAEYAAALAAKDFFAEMGEAGIESGALTHLIPDYVTNLWDLEGTNKAAWAKLTSGPGMSESSRFNMQRKITSIAEGKKLGLKPVTEDVTTIMGIYGNSLSRTMANRQLMESLRNTTVPGGTAAMLMPAPVAPSNYVPINHPQLRGQLVHPDIKGSMEFLFQQKTPAGIMAGIEAVNTGLKRLAVSASLFHAKALTDAFIGAGGNPLKITGMVAGTNKFLRMVREGGAGDIVDKAAEGGLKYTLDKGALADEDLGGSFYKGMDSLKNAVGEVMPGADKLVQGAIDLNHAVDILMWSRLHAGMKLEIFSATYEKLLKNNAEANAKDASKPLKSSKEIATIAASYANDLFGGLNWRRAAEESRTKLGRDLAQAAYAPEGRRAMQLLMFAPDWTISTTRAAAKAFGVGTGVKGLITPQTLADLHRQYLVRSALYYFTVGNALNYALSGHGIMDNKDWTTLELGDGRTMQFSKHMMEPVHWATKPGQQALNKLGFFPSEAIEQAAGVEYLSTGGKAPKIEPTVTAHARHLLKRAVPIAASQGDSGMAAGVSGALGFPIYGKTDEDRKAAKEETKRKKIKKKDAAYEASRN